MWQHMFCASVMRAVWRRVVTLRNSANAPYLQTHRHSHHTTATSYVHHQQHSLPHSSLQSLCNQHPTVVTTETQAVTFKLRFKDNLQLIFNLAILVSRPP